VQASQRLVTEHLGVKHLRLVLGNSMGGMQTWMWAQEYPQMMDVAVPMASLPVEMAGRNWIMRRLIIDSIRRDPANAQFASVFYAFATNGGNQALYKAAPTREKADQILDARLKAAYRADPEDALYQWDSSRDYNPSAGLERIRATVLAINSADDERNPPETGATERAMKRVKNGAIYLIPATEETRGHGTVDNARLWKNQFQQFLESVPHRGM